MTIWKKIRLDEGDTGNYTDSTGKQYHYRKLSKRRGWGVLQGLPDLKFEYIKFFFWLIVAMTFYSLWVIGDEKYDALGFLVCAFFGGQTAMIAAEAANIRTKKSIAYLLPVSAKQYFRRNIMEYVYSLLIFLLFLAAVGFGTELAANGEEWIEILRRIGNIENLAGNLYVLAILIFYMAGTAPLLFMEGKERVEKYIRCLVMVMCLMALASTLICYSPEQRISVLGTCAIYGAMLLIVAVGMWNRQVGHVLEFLLAAGIFFVDDELEGWLDSTDSWGTYHLIISGSGAGRFVIYLLFLAVIVSVPFFWRIAYREAQPYWKMKEAWSKEEQGGK